MSTMYPVKPVIVREIAKYTRHPKLFIEQKHPSNRQLSEEESFDAAQVIYIFEHLQEELLALEEDSIVSCLEHKLDTGNVCSCKSEVSKCTMLWTTPRVCRLLESLRIVENPQPVEDLL